MPKATALDQQQMYDLIGKPGYKLLKHKYGGYGRPPLHIPATKKGCQEKFFFLKPHIVEALHAHFKGMHLAVPRGSPNTRRFYNAVLELHQNGATVEEIVAILGMLPYMVRNIINTFTGPIP